MRLNECVDLLADTFWEKADVELVLSGKIPDIYEDEQEELVNGLANLYMEIDEHSESNRRKIKTTLENNVQILELAWNGARLSDAALKMINELYEEGAARTEEPIRSGARIAAFYLAKLGGKVRIEGLQDGVYIARNVIELPVNYR